MDNISQNKQEIQLLLSEHPSVGIILSERQSIDSVAAALSLHLALQDSGKNSQIVSIKEPIVEQSFLVGIDQISKGFSGITKTLTVSFPYREGEIEKVSYNIEGDRLNVNLFAEENGISFTEKDVRYIKQGSAPTLIFTIGVNSPAELEGIVDPKGAKIVNIDNSVSNSLSGDVVLVDASYSSLSEVIAKLTQELALQVEFDVAQNMLDGIAYATQNFSSPKTSPLAFEMAGVLMGKGAVRKPVKEVRSQSQDTSLQMLNNKDGQPKRFDSNQNKNKQFQPQSQPKKFQPASQDNGSWNQVPQQSRHVEPPRPQQPQPIEETYRPDPIQAPVSTPTPQPAPATTIPTEDEAPSDWFVPKVFKSNKSQD